MKTCGRNGLADFDLTYAHEAIARANACLGEKDVAMRHLHSARLVESRDPDERALAKFDPAAEPWFGLDLSSA